MRIAQITNSSSGSIGTISRLLSEAMRADGIENRIYITSGSAEGEHVIRYAGTASVKLNSLKSHLLGNYGFNSDRATVRLISYLKEFEPDLIHIHNIHGHDLNMERFFAFLASYSAPVIYTFHDCWAFTGYCPHYAYAGCSKWKTGCGACPLRSRFSFFLDRSTDNFQRKQKALASLRGLTIVTPSLWLQQQVEQSFLQKRPCFVINNGIDTGAFRPVVSDVKTSLGIHEPYVVLSAANQISSRKGFADLTQLSGLLPEDFRMVLVGLREEEIQKLPERILGLPRTSDREELVKLYSMADVFVNTTHEDTFPTVNMEALSCGTPVVTYDTGGSAEIVDEATGRVVPEYDVRALCEAVTETAAQKKERTTACRRRALDRYSIKRFTDEYLQLYHSAAEH